MSESNRFPTMYGKALWAAPRRGLSFQQIRFPLWRSPSGRTRAADALLAEGRFEAAERLSHAALEARARATGCRA